MEQNVDTQETIINGQDLFRGIRTTAAILTLAFIIGREPSPLLAQTSAPVPVTHNQQILEEYFENMSADVGIDYTKLKEGFSQGLLYNITYFADSKVYEALNLIDFKSNIRRLSENEQPVNSLYRYMTTFTVDTALVDFLSKELTFRGVTDFELSEKSQIYVDYNENSLGLTKSALIHIPMSIIENDEIISGSLIVKIEDSKVSVHIYTFEESSFEIPLDLINLNAEESFINVKELIESIDITHIGLMTQEKRLTILKEKIPLKLDYIINSRNLGEIIKLSIPGNSGYLIEGKDLPNNMHKILLSPNPQILAYKQLSIESIPGQANSAINNNLQQLFPGGISDVNFILGYAIEGQNASYTSNELFLKFTDEKGIMQSAHISFNFSSISEVDLINETQPLSIKMLIEKNGSWQDVVLDENQYGLLSNIQSNLNINYSPTIYLYGLVEGIEDIYVNMEALIGESQDSQWISNISNVLMDANNPKAVLLKEVFSKMNFDGWNLESDARSLGILQGMNKIAQLSGGKMFTSELDAENAMFAILISIMQESYTIEGDQPSVFPIFTISKVPNIKPSTGTIITRDNKTLAELCGDFSAACQAGEYIVIKDKLLFTHEYVHDLDRRQQGEMFLETGDKITHFEAEIKATFDSTVIVLDKLGVNLRTGYNPSSQFMTSFASTAIENRLHTALINASTRQEYKTAFGNVLGEMIKDPTSASMVSSLISSQMNIKIPAEELSEYFGDDTEALQEIIFFAYRLKIKKDYPYPVTTPKFYKALRSIPLEYRAPGFSKFFLESMSR